MRSRKPLDIDRLHKTIEKLNLTEDLPRYEGKTTAQFALLMGELEVGDPDTIHLVVTPTASFALRMCEYFCAMLDEARIEYQRSRTQPSLIRTARNQLVNFIGCHEAHNHVYGLRIRTVTYDIPIEFEGLPGNLRQYIQSFMEE